MNEEFERARPRLEAMARRMLGSADDARDALQDAWLRVHGVREVKNVEGLFTTTVARICLDVLRSRKPRGEISDVEVDAPDVDWSRLESVALALDRVLETLTPTQRIAFVLHDVCGVAFEEVATVLSCTVVSAKKLASRARSRVAMTNAPSERRSSVELAAKFLDAAQRADVAELIDLLGDTGVAKQTASNALHARTACLLWSGVQPAIVAFHDAQPWLLIFVEDDNGKVKRRVAHRASRRRVAS